VARIVASHTRRRYRALSAVEAGVKDVRNELEEARQALGADGVGTIMFLDEVHRFNKAQQDALLHGVEDGLVVLIGATTENPFFALNTPLLSRSTLWRFEPLSDEEIRQIARRAARAESAEATEEALLLVADLASGDARVAITVIEVAIALARRLDARRGVPRRSGTLDAGVPPRDRGALQPHLGAHQERARLRP
jgi:putative ATPase